MARSRDVGDWEYAGDVVFTGTVSVPDGTITDADVVATANVDEGKLMHRHAVPYCTLQSTGLVVADARPIYTAYKAGGVLGAKFSVETVATGADRALTVDIKKSTAGSTYATILSSVLTIDDEDTARTDYDVTLSGTPTHIAGDLYKIFVAVSGSSGAQAKGLSGVVNFWEDSI